MHFIEKVIGLNRNPFGFRQFPMFLWSQFPHEACRWPIRIFLGGPLAALFGAGALVGIRHGVCELAKTNGTIRS